MSKTVSVIITCYNLEEYISLAIQSVLEQTYSGQTEIIVIDDCSSDNSLKYISNFTGIKLIKNNINQGVLLCTIQGIRESTGEILMFLDGDDVWDINKIDEVVSCFTNSNDTVLVTHNLNFINQSSQTLFIRNRVNEYMSQHDPSIFDSVIRDGILHHDDYVWLGSAYSVHRNLGKIEEFCDFALRLPDPKNTYQDWPLAFWVMCQPNTKAYYINKQLFSYRIHGKNHSGDASTFNNAFRNITRSKNTILAMLEANKIYKIKDAYQYLNANSSYYKYLYDLYSGNILFSDYTKIQILNFFRSKKILSKELIRLFIFSLFRPQAAHKLYGVLKSIRQR